MLLSQIGLAGMAAHFLEPAATAKRVGVSKATNLALDSGVPLRLASARRTCVPV